MAEYTFLTQASLPSLEEYIEEISDIWKNHWVTSMGPKHNQLEVELEEYLDVNNVSVTINGHNALELIIQAYELKGEVITTPFTFISTAHAIVRSGLTPVFCDIKPDDFTIDSDKIENLITENSSAIIPVHVYGNICDVEKIEKIANKHGLKVIYDAAHAFGETFNGKSLATYGDASIYSFHASKVFNSIEGGCIAYNDSGLKDKIFKLRNFGIDDGVSELIGTNAKMNEFTAAMGICNLRHIAEAIQKRKTIYNAYYEMLKSVSNIDFNIDKPGLERNYSYFPIRIKEGLRDRLYELLNANNIQALRNFYPIISEHTCYNQWKKWEETPIAKEIASEILLLPLYENISLGTVEYISSLVRNFMLENI